VSTAAEPDGVKLACGVESYHTYHGARPKSTMQCVGTGPYQARELLGHLALLGEVVGHTQLN
jgi:hypothetical protein